VHDISFKTALIREMRTIDRFNRLIDDGSMSGGKRMLVHLIEAEDLIRRIPWWSRPNSVGISCCVFTGWAATAPSNGFRPISIASALNRPSTSGQSAIKRVMLCSVRFGLPIKKAAIDLPRHSNRSKSHRSAGRYRNDVKSARQASSI
jgi:hypothetical protein